MFGDVGHGLINSIVSILMVAFEKKLSKVHNDMFSLIFAGRYVILLMSLFSVLTGLIYNDFFALGFNIFRSKYTLDLPATAGNNYAKFHGVYAFGIDPYWHWADNSMIFLNSYKMKLSVIIGIA